jgi:hypothetical protein
MEPGNYRLTFGLHRGEQIRNVPVSYLDWMLDGDFPQKTKDIIFAYLKTQAEYDKGPVDWKEGREDYDPLKD